MAAKKKLSEFRPQSRNANLHTERGLGMLDRSIAKSGWIGAITVAADGETFDGSARLETAYTRFGEDVEAIVVETDGSKPVIVKRTDIPTAEDPKAKELAIAANRIAQVDLSWDAEVLAELDDEIDLREFFFEPELDQLLSKSEGGDAIDPNEMWRGMPEFTHDDMMAYQSIKLHFRDEQAVIDFANLIGKKISEKTKSLWFPDDGLEPISAQYR